MDKRKLIITTLSLLNQLQMPNIIEKITSHFSPTYQQVSNGQVSTYSEFIEHLEFLQKATTKLSITIVGAAAYENTVLTHHIVKIWKKAEPLPSLVEVYAHFILEGDLISSCTEVSRTIKGSTEDAELSHAR